MVVKKNRFIKTKIFLSLAFTLILGTGGLSTGVMAANHVSKQNVKVIEASEEGNFPQIIQWNGNLYKVDFDYWIGMLESKDNGKTWESYNGDYETMKFLFKNLTIELYTYEEFLELIQSYKDAVTVTEDTDPRWQETMDWYDELAATLKKEGKIDTYYPMMKGLHFSFDVGPNYPNTTGEVVTVSSYYMEQLYGRLKMILEPGVENGYMSQEKADIIWNQFIKQFNITE